MTIIKQLGVAAKAYIEGLILPSDPKRPLWNSESRIFGKPAKWNYIDNCMLAALTMLSDRTGDARLEEYVLRFTEEYVDPAGGIPTLNISDHNLDNLNGGRTLIRLYKTAGDERFRTAYSLLADQMAEQPRLDCGSFWHKEIYPRQIWLDGAYMALPFMAELGGMDDDISRQLANIRDIMRDSSTGLYFHGYDETRTQSWADLQTGLSREFWLRSMGWLSAGLADICGIAGTSSPLGRLSGEMLDGLLAALTSCMTDAGMLLQLPARPELGGNYPETSGTLLFAYSALKAARLGVCGSDSARAGETALAAVTERYITSDGGVPVLRNICLMAGLGGSPYRDGTAQYYLSERVVANDAKGIAPLLMAYAELLSR